MLLEAIAIKPKKKGPMRLIEQVEITLAAGLVGDCRGARSVKSGERQVTIVSKEQWDDACADLQTEIPWTARRANLLVSGVSFSPVCEGALLYIGRSVVLEITGNTVPCRRMNEAHPRLEEVLLGTWRDGVAGHVIQAGTIRVGDMVSFR